MCVIHLISNKIKFIKQITTQSKLTLLNKVKCAENIFMYECLKAVLFVLFRIRNLRKDVCFHELYVDETQDFTNAELCILIQLCLIPNRIFLTGDTAQCIMQGISFRFKDLRSLFFEIKKNGRDTVNVPEKVNFIAF